MKLYSFLLGLATSLSILSAVALHLHMRANAQTVLTPEQIKSGYVEYAFGPVVTEPPINPGAKCVSGNIAFDERYLYRCAAIGDLHLKDGLLYRWIRIPYRGGYTGCSRPTSVYIPIGTDRRLMRIKFCHTRSFRKDEPCYHPAHGPQWAKRPFWHIIGFRFCRIAMFNPSTGYRLWVYTRWGSMDFDLIFDRRNYGQL